MTGFKDPVRVGNMAEAICIKGLRATYLTNDTEVRVGQDA